MRDTLAPRHHHKESAGRKRFSRKQLISDYLIYSGGIIGIVFTIPQITKIWVEQNASGVSIISWTAYLFVSMCWIYYGYLHRARPIIITNTVWLFLHSLIIVGTYIYG